VILETNCDRKTLSVFSLGGRPTCLEGA